MSLRSNEVTKENAQNQDPFVPLANINRIMKKVLPPHAKIAKEARETVQECVSEFIGFVTNEASEKCHSEGRKTINTDDILYAVESAGFGDYLEPLKLYLERYREYAAKMSKEDKKQPITALDTFGRELLTSNGNEFLMGPGNSSYRPTEAELLLAQAALASNGKSKRGSNELGAALDDDSTKFTKFQ